jgi:hypothetical protein
MLALCCALALSTPAGHTASFGLSLEPPASLVHLHGVPIPVGPRIHDPVSSAISCVTVAVILGGILLLVALVLVGVLLIVRSQPGHARADGTPGPAGLLAPGWGVSLPLRL